MPLKKILLVGHCGADSGTLTHVVGQVAGRIPIECVNNDTHAAQAKTRIEFLRGTSAN
jgi:hypothetical protein